MNTKKTPLGALVLNDGNPRNIKNYKFEKLVKSILTFPKMMEMRPVVANRAMMVLGGNMRLRALQHIAQMTEQELEQTLIRYQREDLTDYWLRWHDKPTVDYVSAEDLTDDEQKEFIVKDNVGYGEWDWDMLANEWDIDELADWGVDLPIDSENDTIEGKMSETGKLSDIEINANIYYEPTDKPNLKIEDCFDLTKFYQKVDFINSLNLSQKSKNTLKTFAYRFIKIDFESVANYYAFNATEEEKKAIERLRLVLVDGGLNGFIEDEILKIAENE